MGRIVGIRLANMVFPEPGGPTISRLCPPAAAIVTARVACHIGSYSHTGYASHEPTRERKLLKETEVLGGYAPSRYITERLRARASDGTSIPISVIGTFALLYFGGYTLNTMTFGGLALGIGMIVDASIVVLENTFPTWSTARTG